MPAPLSLQLHDAPSIEFYGFVHPPFTLAPDPRFLYRSRSHDQALTDLLESIRRREGLMVLTGGSGAGKTMVCRALVERVESTTVASFIPSPALSVEALLREVLVDLGVISKDGASTGRVAAAGAEELVGALHGFVRSLVPLNGRCLLILDEAHRLSPPLLQQIDAFCRDTGGTNALQVVLAGEPGLLETLARPDMQQLDERIQVRATLAPLGREEVAGYIGHRLSIAGGTRPPAFEPAALDIVSRHADGVPRAVNLICDRALTLGAQLGVFVIGNEVAEEAVRGLGLAPAAEETATWWTRIPRWAWIGAGVLLLLAIIAAWSSAAA